MSLPYYSAGPTQTRACWPQIEELGQIFTGSIPAGSEQGFPKVTLPLEVFLKCISSIEIGSKVANV